MKIKTLLLVLVLFLSSFSVVSAYSSSELTRDEEREIELDLNNYFLSVEGREVSLDHYELISDVNLNSEYILARIDLNGYVILSRSNHVVSEYSLISESPYGNSLKYIKVYGGPMNYMFYKDGTYFSTDGIIARVQNIESISEKSKHFLSLKNLDSIDPNQISVLSAPWVGISSTRFARYNSGAWINGSLYSNLSEVGICGTIASAILLAYLDDYVNDKYIPGSIRTRNSTSPGSLITTLAPLIDGQTNYTGTYPNNLYTGVLKFFANNNVKTYSIYGMLATFDSAKTSINGGYPIAIGLLAMLGSSYGDHWVTAYQYQDNSWFDTDYYKVIDNKGNYAKVISINWTIGWFTVTEDDPNAY